MKENQNSALRQKCPIAVFDSGVGGISVLAELISRMPGESYLYFGDSLHAPYGSRSPEEVRQLTHTHIRHLLDLGAKAVVVACNTATGAAISDLRSLYPHVPLIGIEPAIKPAVQAHPGGRILVMATPVTLAGEKFRRLMEGYRQEAEIIPLPAPQLARMIETGAEPREIDGYLSELFSPFREVKPDAVVLGCTHYPFVREQIARASGTQALYDGGAGTARETERRLRECGLLREDGTGTHVQILNSAPEKERIRRCEALLASYTAGENG